MWFNVNMTRFSFRYSDCRFRALLSSDIYMCSTSSSTGSQSCPEGIAVNRRLNGNNEQRTQPNHLYAQVKRVQHCFQERFEQNFQDIITTTSRDT